MERNTKEAAMWVENFFSEEGKSELGQWILSFHFIPCKTNLLLKPFTFTISDKIKLNYIQVQNKQRFKIKVL